MGGRGTERVFGFCGRAEEEEQSETRVEGVDFSLSLLDPKKNVESSDNRPNLAHCQLLDLLLDEAVLGRHVGQGPGPQDGVCRKDGGSHPGGDGDVIGDAVAEPERSFVLFFLSSGAIVFVFLCLCEHLRSNLEDEKQKKTKEEEEEAGRRRAGKKKKQNCLSALRTAPAALATLAVSPFQRAG